MASHRGEWLLVLLQCPGAERVPAGILLRDTSADELHVKLREDLEGIEEDIVMVWNELAPDLSRRAEECAASDVFTWLEESASHVVQVSQRRTVQIVDIQQTIENLYRQHVGSHK